MGSDNSLPHIFVKFGVCKFTFHASVSSRRDHLHTDRVTTVLKLLTSYANYSHKESKYKKNQCHLPKRSFQELFNHVWIFQIGQELSDLERDISLLYKIFIELVWGITTTTVETKPSVIQSFLDRFEKFKRDWKALEKTFPESDIHFFVFRLLMGVISVWSETLQHCSYLICMIVVTSSAHWSMKNDFTYTKFHKNMREGVVWPHINFG